MKLVILEPLGVEEEKLLALAEEKLGNRAEIVYYDTRVTDPDTLAGRAEDADIAVISNLPFKKEVMDLPWNQDFPLIVDDLYGNSDTGVKCDRHIF